MPPRTREFADLAHRRNSRSKPLRSSTRGNLFHADRLAGPCRKGHGRDRISAAAAAAASHWPWSARSPACGFFAKRRGPTVPQACAGGDIGAGRHAVIGQCSPSPAASAPESPARGKPSICSRSAIRWPSAGMTDRLAGLGRVPPARAPPCLEGTLPIGEASCVSPSRALKSKPGIVGMPWAGWMMVQELRGDRGNASSGGRR